MALPKFLVSCLWTTSLSVLHEPVKEMWQGKSSHRALAAVAHAVPATPYASRRRAPRVRRELLVETYQDRVLGHADLTYLPPNIKGGRRVSCLKKGRQDRHLDRCASHVKPFVPLFLSTSRRQPW